MSLTPSPSPSPSTRHGSTAHETTYQTVQRWVADNTFTPTWLPKPLRHPISGYVFATVLEVVATLATLLLVRASPAFSFAGIFNLLVVALAALSWGAAPSLVATLTGTALVELVVLPQTLTGGIQKAGDMVEIGLFVAVGAIIGVVASSIEVARRKAVSAYTQSQARELALRETNARMDDFLAIASHDLRTPLTSLALALHLIGQRLRRLVADIQRGAPPEDIPRQLEVVGEVVSTAEQQVGRQNRLVEDLLDISYIRANAFEYHVAPCDLTAIVQDAVDEQRLSWPDRTIVLDLPDDTSDDTVLVNADAHRIGQVVTNYLTNALKYSPESAPVAVALQVEGTEGHMARVSVRDQGPGLTPEQRDHIWERFHRVPGVTQQSGSGVGLGLGLHIARTIIEYHGGEVGIESVSGCGSTFWFTLPLAAPAAAAAAGGVSPPHG